MKKRGRRGAQGAGRRSVRTYSLFHKRPPQPTEVGPDRSSAATRKSAEHYFHRTVQNLFVDDSRNGNQGPLSLKLKHEERLCSFLNSDLGDRGSRDKEDYITAPPKAEVNILHKSGCRQGPCVHMHTLFTWGHTLIIISPAVPANSALHRKCPNCQEQRVTHFRVVLSLEI